MMKQQNPTPHGDVIWDAPDSGAWTAETAHNAGVTSIPLRDVVERSFAEGFRTSFEPLGVPLSHVEMRHINGWPYTSFFLHDVPRKAGPPPPALVLKLITRIHPAFRRRNKIAAAAIAENRALCYSDAWFAERESWIDRILQLQRQDLASMSPDELADHLQKVAALSFDGLKRHFDLVAGCIPLGHWLRRSKDWGLGDAEARWVVMHNTPVHNEARRRIRRIAQALGDSAIDSSVDDFDSIRAHSAEASAALDDYLDHHGWWAAEDHVKAPRILDHPEAIIRTIASHRGLPDRGNGPITTSALERLRAQVAAGERDEFDRLITEAHRAHTMLDDNSGILASWTSGVAGYTLRHVGLTLKRLGRVSEAEHIDALTLEELVDLLRDRSGLTPVTAGQRFSAWKAQGELTPPLHLNGEPSPPPDPSVFTAPVAQLVGDIGAYLSDKFNEEHRASGIGTRTVTGRAVVTRNASEAIARLEDGDILVTTSTTPAYNNILPVAGGLVVSEGGPSCHAAIVARELDLPTIVGLSDATTTIPDGAIIELDPVAATVRITTQVAG